jgi:HD-GYP domain-containing protein (c-di-GMP phosphodiesterase class II)
MIRHDYSAEELDTPFMTLLLNIMENHHEALDGTGLFGKTAHELDMVARMACICDAFDGYSVTRPHFGDRDISINAVITRMSDEKSGHFDPKLLSLFAGMMEQHYNINQNFVDQIQK